MDKTKKNKAHPLYTSILLLLMAVAAVTAATMAWLSIADNTKVRSMNLDVTSGISLRFDLDPHDTFEDYVKTLTFSNIADRISREQGFSMADTPLKPVTTSDFTTFSFENGTVVPTEKGAYLEFTLHFMSTKDMIVHLTSLGSTDGASGTNVSSNNGALPSAMRISFTADGATYVYEPDRGDSSSNANGATYFGLPVANQMVYSDNNRLFSLTAGENKPVLVHIWLEGTDPSCTDELKGADYSIALRFEGTDENNQLFEEEENNPRE